MSRWHSFLDEAGECSLIYIASIASFAAPPSSTGYSTAKDGSSVCCPVLCSGTRAI